MSVQGSEHLDLFRFYENQTAVYCKDNCENQTFIRYLFCKVIIVKANFGKFFGSRFTVSEKLTTSRLAFFQNLTGHISIKHKM